MVQATGTGTGAAGGDYVSYDPLDQSNTFMSNSDATAGTAAALSRYIASDNVFKTQYLDTE